MNLAARQEGQALIISVREPRIDAASAIRFKDGIRDLLAGWEGRVVLDLESVGFLDSSGLGAIVSVMKALPRGGTMELAGLSANVDRVFRLTRMDTVFAIHADTTEAMRDHAG